MQAIMNEDLNQDAWQLQLELELQLSQLPIQERDLCHQCFLSYCDTKSYLHFVISIILMVAGLILTILGILSFASNDYITFEGQGHEVQPLVFLMLLLGPILINVAAIIAVKNIVYLRRKALKVFSIRRRAQILALSRGEGRENLSRCSVGTLPPPYESVVRASVIDPPNYTTSLMNNLDLSSEDLRNEPPPPTYEDIVDQFDQLHYSSLIDEEKADISAKVQVL